MSAVRLDESCFPELRQRGFLTWLSSSHDSAHVFRCILRHTAAWRQGNINLEPGAFGTQKAIRAQDDISIRTLPSSALKKHTKQQKHHTCNTDTCILVQFKRNYTIC